MRKGSSTPKKGKGTPSKDGDAPKLGSALKAGGLASVAKLAGKTLGKANERREEQKRAEWRGEWKKWVSGIGVCEVVIDALELPTGDEQQAFDYMKGLGREEVSALLSKRELAGLTDTVMAGLDTIRGQYASSGAALAEEYKTSAKFQMGYGGLDDFFGG